MSSEHPEPPVRGHLVTITEPCGFCDHTYTGTGSTRASAGRAADRAYEEHLRIAHPVAYAKSRGLTPPPNTQEGMFVTTQNLPTAPVEAVDIVVLAELPAGLHALVIQRGRPPHLGRWALPGGKVDAGESPERAAARELAEETGLVVVAQQLRLVGRYDTPGRDPRGPIASTAYLSVLDQMIEPRAGDDAAAARWVPVEYLLADPDVLAFDHQQILVDALTTLEVGQ